MVAADTPRRTVYKHVIESPYTTERDWPVIDTALREGILQDLCSLIAPIGKYKTARADVPQRTKKRKVTATKSSKIEKDAALISLESQCTIGFNACTRALEAAIKVPHDLPWHINVIFVCKEDLSSPQYYEHFPTLCKLAAEANHPVHLLGLPEKAEIALGKALGLPRVGCVALHDGELVNGLVEKVKANVPLPESEILANTRYKDLKVKTLITSAPIVQKGSKVKQISSIINAEQNCQ